MNQVLTRLSLIIPLRNAKVTIVDRLVANYLSKICLGPSRILHVVSTELRTTEKRELLTDAGFLMHFVYPRARYPMEV
jgi:hypothetical protein